MPDNNNPIVDDQQQRAERTRLVVDECIRRRADGEIVSDTSLFEDHPDLLPELADQLRALCVIEMAQTQFDNQSAGLSSGLCVRCPHCRYSLDIVDSTQLSDVMCSSCGSIFNLVENPPSSQATELQRVGQFQLLDRLGVGAFGSVWSARDVELDRLVAVKFPRKDQMNAQDVEQFIREARASAQLNHPQIVQVYEVGREDDRMYIVTDLIQGRDLAEWLIDKQASPHEAAELCAQVADALDHAHKHGVIHRDLKPSNIMIDNDGNPHLMDFGLAKREASEITMTMDGKLVGTPAYMSPEQARGSAHQADQRTDIYSLGVILYELLTGERPFRGSTRMLLHQILFDEAPTPRKLNGNVPRDLETICLKCLEKETAKRYHSARELYDELQRFLKGEAILARPISAIARSWRWGKRNPLLATVGAIAVILLLFLAIAGPLVAINQTKHAERYRWQLYASDMKVAIEAWESANVGRVVDLLKHHVPRRGQKDLRKFEWYYLWQLCKPSEDATSFPIEHVGSICFSFMQQKGITLAFSGGRKLFLCDPVTGQKQFAFEAQMDLIPALAFSRDAQFLATGSWDGTVKLWAVGGNKPHAEMIWKVPEGMDRAGPALFQLAFLPDNKLMATITIRNQVEVWDVLARRRIWSVEDSHDRKVQCVAISPDGTRLASADINEIIIWELPSGRRIRELEGHGNVMAGLAFSPNGATLASASQDHRIKLWDVASGENDELKGQESVVLWLKFSPDGKTLASSSLMGTINLWNVESVKEGPTTLKGHSNSVGQVAFSPDGRFLASTGNDMFVKLWQFPTAVERDTFDGQSVVFSTRGDRLIALTNDKHLNILDTSNGELKENYPIPNSSSTACSLDGRKIAIGNPDGTVQVRSLAAGKPRTMPVQPESPSVQYVMFSPNGKILASVAGVSREQVLKLWDLESDKVIILPNHPLSRPAFSPDSQRVATIITNEPAKSYSVKLWDIQGKELRTFDRSTVPLRSLAFSAKGTMLASASFTGEIGIWNVATGERAQITMKGHAQTVNSLAFSPDGSRLASASSDTTIKLWDVETGDEMITLKGHDSSVISVAFSLDGRTLASASEDDVIKLWRAATEDEGW